ncbi:hypothetical protein ACLOJK_019608 [Asimina triloba]
MQAYLFCEFVDLSVFFENQLSTGTTLDGALAILMSIHDLSGWNNKARGLAVKAVKQLKQRSGFSAMVVVVAFVSGGCGHGKQSARARLHAWMGMLKLVASEARGEGLKVQPVYCHMILKKKFVGPSFEPLPFGLVDYSLADWDIPLPFGLVDYSLADWDIPLPFGMESKEIKSPGDLLENSARSDLNSDLVSHKKLGIYFAESDDRRTAISGGYVGGTTPVNIHGKPITNLSQTGGWIAAFFIFGNEMAERMAYFGLSVNMVAFMFYIMHRPFTSSANAVNTFLGISQASSVLGGFLADAYLGRYWTIAIFTTIYLAAIVTLYASLVEAARVGTLQGME